MCIRDRYGPAWANILSLVDFVRTILDRARPEARIELRLPPGAKRPDADIAGEAQ